MFPRVTQPIRNPIRNVPTVSPSGPANGPAATFKRMVANGKRCLLCGGPPVIVGLYLPNDQAGVGAPRGKVRTYAYLLCERHAALPRAEAAEAAVERNIASDIARTRVSRN